MKYPEVNMQASQHVGVSVSVQRIVLVDTERSKNGGTIRLYKYIWKKYT